MKVFKLQENLLLLRLKRKDPEAFAKVYDQYLTPIYRFIYFKVNSAQDAEDLTSEVFLKTWNYITETEEEIENLRALLYRIARNLVVDFYRAKSKRDLVQDDQIMEAIPDERQQNLLSGIDQSIELEIVDVALKKMKDEYREVIVLRYIEELSISEIAKILDKSKGSVRVLLHRAIKVAKELLTKNG